MEEVEKCHTELNKSYKRSFVVGWITLTLGVMAVAACLLSVYVAETDAVAIFFTILALFDVGCLYITVRNLMSTYNDKRIMDDLYNAVKHLHDICSEEDSEL